MSIYYFLITGVSVGCIAGFCIKHHFCSELPIYQESDTETDSDNIDLPDYINYLEHMLDDSTVVTTESIPLQAVAVDSQNITAELVQAVEVTPSAPPLSQV
jgi:hypothetical protein